MTSTAPRQVDCNAISFPTASLDPFVPFFRNFEESESRIGKEAVQFMTACPMSLLPDFAEYSFAMSELEAAIGPANVSVSDARSIWTAQLSARASVHLNQSNFMAASFYYQLAERTMNNHSSSEALAMFKKSVLAFAEADNGCHSTVVQWQGHSLPAYWCPTPSDSSQNATVIGMTGFDGTNEGNYGSIARPALEQGYNVLLVEGPGQGSAARFLGLRFIPNYDSVVEAAADFIEAKLGQGVPIVLWCRSMGGYLCATAGSVSRLRKIVLDGGISDFYQTVMCKIPAKVRALYSSNREQFNGIMAQGAKISFGLAQNFAYAELGYGGDTFGDYLDAMSAYALSSSQLAAPSVKVGRISTLQWYRPALCVWIE